MNSICNYTGPANDWSLSLNAFGTTETFFEGIEGCCNNIIETSFPDHTFAFLYLLFEQIGANNETISSYQRSLQSPKEYTGLVGSQVHLRAESANNDNNYIRGVQKYINCSDAKNLVMGAQKLGLSTGDIILLSIGSVVGAVLIGVGICGRPCKGDGYQRL